MSIMRRGNVEAAAATTTPAVIDLPAAQPRRRGGVRRKALDPRTAKIELRTTPARKAAIRADAKKAGMTISAYLLANLAGSAAEPPPLVALADPLLIGRALAELGKWGSNWNQLARDRNTTGQDPILNELERIRAALLEIRRALLQALGQ
jgi:hypothetical protein